MIRHSYTLLGIVISALLLWLALRTINFEEVSAAFGAANYALLVPALALYFTGVAVRAVRWRVLLAPLREVAAGRLFPIVVMGYMANDILPARLGEVVRVDVLRRREGISRAASLATVLIERISDGLCLIIFAAVTLPLVALTGDWRGPLLFTAALFAGAAAILVVIAARPTLAVILAEPIIRVLPRGLRGRARSLVESVVRGLSVLGGIRATLWALGLTVVAWLCEAGLYLTLLWALAIEGPPLVPLAILATSIANLGTLVPSSPGYVGVFHYLVQQVLTQAGVRLGQATVYAVLVHAALIVPVTLLGLYYVWRLGLGKSWLRAISRTPRPSQGDRAAAGVRD